MHWFSSTQGSKDNASSTQEDSKDNASPFKWPPTFQSFEEYKAELNEAVAAHPPFGAWLRQYRNVKHITESSTYPDPMWQLSVQQLKERYVTSATLANRSRHAKRVFAEMHMEENQISYQVEEDDFEKRRESFALALDAYQQAHRHGYSNVPRPREPQRSEKLVEHDKLNAAIAELSKVH